MEETKFEDDGDGFRDALDEFEFFDCSDAFPDPIGCSSGESISDPCANQSPEEDSPPPATLRRRSHSSKKSSSAESTKSEKLSSSEDVDKYLRERKALSSRKLEQYEEELGDSKVDSQKNEKSEEKSTVTDAIAAARDDESNSRGSEESNSSLLFKLAEYVYEWLKEQRAIWKLGLKFGWGLLWSAYVCSVLVGLLFSSFLMGGILINTVVEEPIRITRSLNFDYSLRSPEAFVPIMSNVKMNRDAMHLVEKPRILKGDGSRALPRHHRMQVAVSLTLPESEYNQRLGIFQVRVDFLSSDSQVLATSRRPCMLPYRSHSIRLLLTLLKLAPILTGYTSETQTLKVNFKDFAEGETPTACLRVVLEQRAEYSPGAGIPEIYTASLALESELPLLKRIVWFWKKTLFVWVSMTMFTTQLIFALLCCRPFLIPTIRLWGSNPRDASHVHR